jgi:hypothetical protein
MVQTCSKNDKQHMTKKNIVVDATSKEKERMSEI